MDTNVGFDRFRIRISLRNFPHRFIFTASIIFAPPVLAVIHLWKHVLQNMLFTNSYPTSSVSYLQYRPFCIILSHLKPQKNLTKLHTFSSFLRLHSNLHLPGWRNHIRCINFYFTWRLFYTVTLTAFNKFCHTVEI